MITREDVADLRDGDFVEVIETCCGDEITTRGPLRASRYGKGLDLGDLSIRTGDGSPAAWFHTLTVVSRAPRPLYVNHDRTEPVPGDVVRDADGDGPAVWMRSADADWSMTNGSWTRGREDLPTRLRLLVDGETGQVVP